MELHPFFISKHQMSIIRVKKVNLQHAIREKRHT